MSRRATVLPMCLIVAVIVLVSSRPALAKIWTVEVANFSFSPANLTVMVGDTVKWQWFSGTHTTTSGSNCSSSGLWNAPLSSSSPSFQRQFGSPGVYPYFCQPHCFSGMTGTITVEMVTGVLDGRAGIDLPDGYALGQNFPNPFNASTVITYTLSSPANVSLEVFDILGRRVMSLVNERLEPGVYETTWDGRDNTGSDLASGTYFYRLQLGDQIFTRKMVMLK